MGVTSLTGYERMSGIQLPIKVWDLPVRLFHWTIVLLLGLSWISAELLWMQIHLMLGYTTLAALLFRLVWGFVGSDTARFSSFLRNPLEGLQHLRHLNRREPDTQIGHNAAGGWMVLVLLLLLAVQVGTGLFANTFEDLDINGPLATYVARRTSNRLTAVHAFNFNLILAAVGLHIAAITAYALLKGQNLLRPMITGTKRLPGTIRAPRIGSPLLGATIFAAVACLVALFVNLL
jgi:cytochrome b